MNAYACTTAVNDDAALYISPNKYKFLNMKKEKHGEKNNGNPTENFHSY